MSASVILEGELRKAYEEFVASKHSLSQQQIAKLKTVTHLPDDFLNGYDERFKKITAIDVSMFVSVVHIGSRFMCGCSALTSADLSALTSLSIIGSDFLCDCSALTSVTLPSTSKITKIDYCFLAGCSSLTAINNMQALSNVTSIDYSFLEGCSSLETVDFLPLSNVKSVDKCFLYNCPKLTKKEHLDQVDITPLLHLSDNDIMVSEDYEADNNLKTALARVRSGGANGPKFVASSSSTSSSPTAASQSSSSSACQNCKKLNDKLDCKDMQIAKLEQEKEGEKQQHAQLLNKQAERLREFSDQKQKLEADLTSLKDENTRQLEKLRDQANLLQDLKQKQEASSGVTSASGGGNNEAVLIERCKAAEALREKAEAALVKAEAALAEARQDKQKAEERADKLMAKLLG